MLGIRQDAVHICRIDCRNPGLLVGDAVGNQQALLVGMPGQAGGELDSLLVEEEWPAHSAQGVRLVEPDEAVLIESSVLGGAPQNLEDHGEPAAVEPNQLR